MSLTTLAASAVDTTHDYLEQGRYELVTPELAAADPRTPDAFLLLTPLVSSTQLRALLNRPALSPALRQRCVSAVARGSVSTFQEKNALIVAAVALPGLTHWNLFDLGDAIVTGTDDHHAAVTAVLTHPALRTAPTTGPGRADRTIARILCLSSATGTGTTLREQQAARLGSLVPAALALLRTEPGHEQSTPRIKAESALRVVDDLEAACDGDLALRHTVAALGVGWTHPREALLQTAAGITSASSTL